MTENAASAPAAPAHARAGAASARLHAGDRVRVVAAPRMNGYFIGEVGTVWCADRTGAVVTLDSRGVADTRFITAELELVTEMPAAIDRDHWAVPMVTQLAAAIDAFDDATFELLAAVHAQAVCAVMAAYRPGSTPAITSSIVGADAWHGVFALASALGVPVPD